MLNLTIRRKGGPSSGWYSPPKGTHSGDKHRAVGSGKVSIKRGEGKAALGGVTYEWFDSPAARGLFASDIKRRDRGDITFVLVTTKVPAKHLDELIIRTSAAYGYTLGITSYEVGTKRSAGFYVPHKGLSEVYVHPYMVRGLGGVIVHEVGHHVWQQYKWRTGEDRAKIVAAKAADISGKLKGWSSGDLKKIGLRKYSTSKPGELIADAYMVKHSGKPSQWKDLSGFCKGLGLDLDEIFGE